MLRGSPYASFLYCYAALRFFRFFFRYRYPYCLWSESHHFALSRWFVYLHTLFSFTFIWEYLSCTSIGEFGTLGPDWRFQDGTLAVVMLPLLLQE